MSTQTFRISKLAQGICEFVPVTFQDQYFSLLNLQVQSVLLDFRFRIKNLELAPKKLEDENGRIKASQEATNGDKNGVKLGATLPFQAQTVADFFFADDTGQLPEMLNFKEVDLIYNDYIRVMACMHEKLKFTYNQFVTKFLSPEKRAKLNMHPDTSTLQLPGQEPEEETKEEAKKEPETASPKEAVEVEDQFSERKQTNHTSIP